MLKCQEVQSICYVKRIGRIQNIAFVEISLPNRSHYKRQKNAWDFLIKSNFVYKNIRSNMQMINVSLPMKKY